MQKYPKPPFLPGHVLLIILTGGLWFFVMMFKWWWIERQNYKAAKNAALKK